MGRHKEDNKFRTLNGGPSFLVKKLAGQIADGKTLREIATSEGLSCRTMENRFAAIKSEFHAKNLAHFASTFLRNGWIT